MNKQINNFLIEGNIGAGKSTLLEKLKENQNAQINVVPEPVHIYTNYNGHNYLQYFYDNPRKWTFAFQQIVLNVTANQYRKNQNQGQINLFERSMYSPLQIFAQEQFEKGVLCEAEMELLKKITNDICEWINYDIKGIIYVRTSPEISMERMKARSRVEECTIPIEYLQDLHKLHEQWLFYKKDLSLPVLIYENNKNAAGQNTEAIQEFVYQWMQNPTNQILDPQFL
ncbi:hypothetical protein IMG5_134510 [Ichthyophthirius multifiliis]|uniref:Deoxynucleoside kinase domain-containing protein n=1 Tax=Ichthyophthirius multifiliis TaxID=5932 RepID=G0QWR5_ICHMU|nr:hypothetical protein IMG5_134510 [Ichthyophthirius multifiliis]EGR30336.1 hypothetical protein IMG5_134510 [Ichthyophthirius multifiliis]|eukprot:XP_004031923.1 hypothetical protein IMG5_134510 [Ichthyophthirius multifiliis]